LVETGTVYRGNNEADGDDDNYGLPTIEGESLVHHTTKGDLYNGGPERQTTQSEELRTWLWTREATASITAGQHQATVQARVEVSTLTTSVVE
jgi:hypothetical protein